MFTKKTFVLFLFLYCTVLCGCTQNELPFHTPVPKEKAKSTPVFSKLDPNIKTYVQKEGKTTKDRFALPMGYQRILGAKDSFSAYLQEYPLKPDGEKVHFYTGDEKGTNNHMAVMDMDVGDRDLQQCADAVMRFRAEYFYKKNEFEKIKFHFVNGFLADYATWTKGFRIAIKGNTASWVKRSTASTSYASFRQYLDMVYSYAGTLSLHKEMQDRPLKDMQVGDVFINGGMPGHCVIIVDMAKHMVTGKKIFMVAQSYMPAQETHILKNYGDGDASPWYPEDFGEVLDTPEWNFSKNDLKRF